MMTYAALMLAAALTAAPSDDGLFPFVIRPDAADTAMDMSALLPAPAGKNGFLRREGEHFVDARGNRVRLNGTNLTGAGNFPSHEDADLLAARFARLGLNCVRLHFFDVVKYSNFLQGEKRGLFQNDPSGKVTVVDEAQRDRLDYMIAAFKRHGVYVNMNLHVGRELGPADGVRKTCWANRGVNFFCRELIDAEKAYAREILCRKNPYLGHSLAEDPAMALVEITNENALFQVYWSDTIRNQGADPWYYEEFHRLREAAGYNATTNGISKFIVETEKKYFREMVAFLKDEVGVKCPVYGTQLDYTAPWVMADTCEAIDAHIYWGHPTWESPKWSYGRIAKRTDGIKWKFRNCAVVDAEHKGDYANPFMNRGARRVRGLPFLTTECAAPYPNWYGAEYQPMLHAYAAFQDWAGVFAYTWNSDESASPDCNEWFFSHAARTDCVAHFPACAALFLRGDVATARRRIDVPVDVESRYALIGKIDYPIRIVDTETADARVPNATFFRHALAVDLTGRAHVGEPPETVPPSGPVTSDTDELTLYATPDSNSVFTVNAPNVKFLSGHTDGRRYDLGGVAFEPGKTKLGWSAVSLVSREANGFGRGARLLLAATGYTHNGGASFHRKDAIHWGGITEEFGTEKMVTEGVPLTVTLPVDGAKCWALDEAGARKGAVPVRTESGRSVLSVGPDCKTVWYEIQL